MKLEELLMKMVELDASDLYLKVANPPMMRVDGRTRPIEAPPLTPDDTRELSEEAMRQRERDIFQKDWQVDLSYVIQGVGQFRGNIYLQRGNVAMVWRKINARIPDIESLGLPEVTMSLAVERRGLVLVTGATGSGKSTTLAAMIDYRNTHTTGHIVTIEDPIEFVHVDKGCIVSQREVGLDVPHFHAGLRAALRQAPDVLLIGEMRDEETAESAIHFAETGHLVFSTLHSTNAAQTLERILQFFPAERHGELCQLLANNLKGILSQRLVPRLDGGRVAAIEVLVNTPRVSELLRKGAVGEIKSAIAAGDRDGMQTFGQHLFKLYEQGVISQDEALSAADSSADLRLRMRGFSAAAV